MAKRAANGDESAPALSASMATPAKKPRRDKDGQVELNASYFDVSAPLFQDMRKDWMYGHHVGGRGLSIYEFFLAGRNKVQCVQVEVFFEPLSFIGFILELVDYIFEPFLCCTLQDFLKEEELVDGHSFIVDLKDSLMKLKFSEKNNDLYQFKQVMMSLLVM